MNRLIIVGNGFDKAHGLDSDYYSFIKDYLYNAIENFVTNKHYDDLLISIHYNRGNSPLREIYIPDIDKNNVFNTIQEFQKRTANMMLHLNVSLIFSLKFVLMQKKDG